MRIMTFDKRSKLTLKEIFTGFCESPIGFVKVGGTSDAITSVHFVDQRPSGLNTNSILNGAVKQVSEYFLGTRREFDFPIALEGTEFQRLVWQQLTKVPYGQTVSYKEIAQVMGRPKAVRAVGAANGRNPISIILPCHRVVGSDGSLTGYGGGLWRKEWLLSHEKSFIS